MIQNVMPQLFLTNPIMSEEYACFWKLYFYENFIM